MLQALRILLKTASDCGDRNSTYVPSDLQCHLDDCILRRERPHE